MKGYKDLPGFPGYLINEQGSVYNTVTENFLEGSFNPDGYLNYRLKDETGHWLTIGRHRVMCIAYKETDLDIADLVSNHINGIKGDDRLDNLEWTTYTGNIEHAGANGLTEKCIPFACRNVYTGEVKEFPSVIKGAKALGLTKDALLYRLRFQPERVFPEGNQYQSGQCHLSWPEVTDIEKSMETYTSNRKVEVKNLITGEVVKYDSLTKASLVLKFTIGYLSEKINDESQPLVLPHYLLKWATSDTPWRETEHLLIEEEKIANGRFAVALDEETGKWVCYSSVTSCGNAFGLIKTTMAYRLSQKGKKVYDGKRFFYLSDFVRSTYWVTDKCINP